MAAQRGEETAAAAVGWYGSGRSWQEPAGPRGAGTLLPGSRSEVPVARQVRARGLAAGWPPADIAAAIASACGTTQIRAFRLALGVSLPDVVAQVQARYEADGRQVPGFSETLLSAYESGHKRPGTEYLHYLCASYGVDPADLGFETGCLCGRSHRAQPAGSGEPARTTRVREPVAGLMPVPMLDRGPEAERAPEPAPKPARDLEPEPEPEPERTMPLPPPTWPAASGVRQR